MAHHENTTKTSLVTALDSISSLIYVVRGQQVMVDSDLAMLYQVETRVLNQAVKRNPSRFPERYCFQLTKEEYENLKSQSVTSSSVEKVSGYGGRRKLPFVFCEQGIAMLSSVLNSEKAISVNLRIMDAFVEMRRFLIQNSALFERISAVELKQLQYQQQSDEKFEQIFGYIADHAESEQKVFFDGQIYDAFSLLVKLIKKAKSEIILIDNYVDVGTLNILAKKGKNVDVQIYTLKRAKLTTADINKFNSQYPTLTVKNINTFHDRFLILDKKEAYLIGASLKDAGNKCFGISLIRDKVHIKDILSKL